jgi:hypothetical protein
MKLPVSVAMSAYSRRARHSKPRGPTIALHRAPAAHRDPGPEGTMGNTRLAVLAAAIALGGCATL